MKRTLLAILAPTPAARRQVLERLDPDPVISGPASFQATLEALGRSTERRPTIGTPTDRTERRPIPA